MTKLMCCALAAVVLTGCLNVEEEFATAAVTSSLEAARKQSAAREVFDVADDACEFTAAQAAAEAASRPNVSLFPEGCATKTADGFALHVEYDGCTGAFGKVQLNGGLDATFHADNCALTADIVDSGNLTANYQAFRYAASAEIDVLPGSREVALNSRWSGTTAKGKPIKQTANWDIRFDAETCIDMTGHADGDVDGTPYTLDVAKLAMCPGACPSAGTVVAAWEGEYREREVTVAFDGTNVARVTGWTDTEYQVEMLCDPVSDAGATR